MAKGILDLLGLKRQVEGIAGEVHGLRREIEALRRQRENVANAPVPREDIKAALRSWVAGRVSLYEKQLGITLSGLIRNPAAVMRGDYHELTLTGSSFHRAGGLNPNGQGSTDAAFCALLGESVVPAIERVIDAMEWPEAGLPMAARTKKLAELDATIAQRVAQEAELTSTARAAGILIADQSPAERRALGQPGGGVK